MTDPLGLPRMATVDLKVSVVIVSFRSARLAIDCLRSLERERATSCLKISAQVIDNDSGDYPVLARAVEEHGWGSWITLLRAARNGGFAYGNNIGIRRALETDAADYVFILNPDTEVRPGAIDALVHFLELHSDAGIAGSSLEGPDGSQRPISFRFPTLISEACTALGVGFVTRLFKRWEVAVAMRPIAQPVDWVCGASMMVHSKVIRVIGGMDENYFLYFEETDFCFRARQAGFSTWYVPESRVMHMIGQSTGATERTSPSKGIPEYWFESRRRYFALTLGIARAMLLDLLVLLLYPLGSLKRALVGKRSQSVPRYLRDLWRHTILRPKNRTLASIRTYRPGDRDWFSASPLR